MASAAALPAAIAELTAERWSQLPPGYRPHVVDLLARATGGNPFFLTELLHELAHAADLPHADARARQCAGTC
jgi:hypothetical protein